MGRSDIVLSLAGTGWVTVGTPEHGRGPATLRSVPSACGLLLRSCPCLCESVWGDVEDGDQEQGVPENGLQAQGLSAGASFPLEVVADREHAQPQDIDQMAEATCVK